MGVAVGLFVVAAVLAVVAGLAAAGGLPAGAAVRRPLTVGAAVAAVLVAGAGAVFAMVVEDEALEAADAPVLAVAVGHRGPGLTRLAELVSLYGGTAFTGGAAVVAAAVMLWRGHRRWALVWVLGVLAGALTIRLLKSVVERPRPPVATRLAVETSTSLPSGHALMSALGLGLVAAAVLASTAPRAVRAVVTVLAVLLAATIGASRVYLGVHWTTDVTAGWLLGAALVTVCVTVVRVLDARAVAPPPEPVAAAGDPDDPVSAVVDGVAPNGSDGVDPAGDDDAASPAGDGSAPASGRSPTR